MKKSGAWAGVCAAVCAGLFLSSCSADDGKTLYLFNWTYYTPDSVIQQFEQEFGVTVHVDSFASNEEMFAKLKAGAAGYDIVVPSQDYVSIMIKEGMLAPIDHAQFPNSMYISDLVLDKATYDPQMQYSVPYFMGAAGIAVNTEKVQDYARDWSIFADTRLKNHMSMLDDMREVLGDALSYLGYSVNSLSESELAEAKQLVIEQWKPNLVKFDAEGFGKSFASGDFWAVQGYAEVVFGEVPEAQWDTIDFFIPEDGGPITYDSKPDFEDFGIGCWLWGAAEVHALARQIEQDEATGITGTHTGNAAEAPLYDLQVRRILRPQPGRPYIRSRNEDKY